ncbi:MAG: histidinol-phosphatase, partial [Firmicutes bacterium]|nr:histidinol-phosphatase [Bacillota bacterium]
FIHAGGIIGSLTGRTSAGARNRNTDLIIAAVESNDIYAVSHPGAKNPVDIAEVAACCARRGTLLEINEKHGELSVESIRTAAESDANFVLGSDAHRPENVGRVGEALQRAREAGLQLSRIVNLRIV